METTSHYLVIMVPSSA
jgi:hypothetical protein